MSALQEHGRAVGLDFRTIQERPKDLRTAAWQGMMDSTSFRPAGLWLVPTGDGGYAGHETPRVHHAARGCGGMAARCSCARAGGSLPIRVLAQWLAPSDHYRWLTARAARARVHREPEYQDRLRFSR